jgi:hypothetical protein
MIFCALHDRNYNEPAESRYSSKPPDAQIVTVIDSAYGARARLSTFSALVRQEMSPFIIEALHSVNSSIQSNGLPGSISLSSCKLARFRRIGSTLLSGFSLGRFTSLKFDHRLAYIKAC